LFESAEIGHKLAKREFKREEPKLRERLLALQYRLLEKAEFPVIILVNGVDGAGKGETVNLLNEWMDPRHIRTRAFRELTDAERERPEMWRFWRELAPKGHIGILFGSWYTDPILKRVMGHEKKAVFAHRLERIRHFERMLVAEGAVLLKLWFHLSKKAQKKRLKELSADKKTAWRVGPGEWERFRRYDEFVDICEDALRDTSTGEAPWLIVDGSDEHYRALLAGRTLLEAIGGRLEAARGNWVPRQSAPPLPPALDRRNLLGALVLRQPLGKDDYERELARWQGRLARLTRRDAFGRRSLVLVFEGADAAGKGGAIRRVTAALDARQYEVIPVAAPTEEERAQPYLWRFWRHLPRQGKVAIFDRSWYGRVLVERVEGYCSSADWMRAYAEIDDFEDQLVAAGSVVVKFWLAVSKDEQLARFEEREAEPHKRYKITAEDWRNREQWDAYAQAVCDMVDRTSTAIAPWTLVEADDKRYARIKVLRTICERLAAVLGD
jgi:polyphosphate:AMP phosphotransferase